MHIVIQEKSKVGALVSHPLCPVGSWGACTPPATAAQAHLFSPVASALWPLPTTPPFLLLFPHSPPSYVFSHTFSSSFPASPRHYTPRAPARCTALGSIARHHQCHWGGTLPSHPKTCHSRSQGDACGCLPVLLAASRSGSQPHGEGAGVWGGVTLPAPVSPARGG